MSATSLKGLDSLNNYSYAEILKQNLISFFDWGFLNKAGFSNITIPATGAYGGDFSRLRSVSDARYASGRVWEAPRMNWVWETGLEPGLSPTQISGVFVGSTFYPIDGGVFHINYPLGQVVFNTGIATNSVVRVAYSHKWINVTSSSAVPWLRLGQQRSYRPDDTNFLTGSGTNLAYGDARMQFPTVAIEIANENYAPFAIGGYQYCRTRVTFFVIGEDESSVTRLAHIIGSQKEKTIQVYDPNRLASEDKFPLNQHGTLRPNPVMYPRLVTYSGDGGYQLTRGLLYGKVTFIESQVQDLQQLTTNLYQKPVTLTTEGILTGI